MASFSTSSSSSPSSPQPLSGGVAALREFAQLWQAEVDDYVIAMEFSPDGRQVAVAPEGGPIAVLDAGSGEVVHRLKGHRGGNNALSWHPSSRVLATGGQDGFIHLWNFGGPGSPFSQDKSAPAASAAPAAPGAVLTPLLLEGGEGWVEHLAWSRPDSSNPTFPRLASASGRTLRLWDSLGKLVREFVQYPKAISALKWLGSKQMISTASFGGVAVWGSSDGQLKRTLDYRNPLISLSWSPDLRWCVAGTQDQGIHVWRTTHQPDEMQMSGFAAKVREMAWHKGSRWFVTGGAPEVAVWDCGGPGPAGREPRQLAWHEDIVSAVACQARGPLAVSGAADGGLAVWNVEVPNVDVETNLEVPLSTLNLAAELVQLAWSPDDRLVLTGDSDGEVRLFRVGL
ncbi:hypothetical protein DB346_23430 [Verrucomicrobia bacterium LW23]|nr:hypothetical protein DB346_23430 [Verrucomicrobia bacterium LW23]